ncbi:MAG: oxygen-independent coproporphyrinogen III oxidase [Holophaga sp.]|nr:oxygen-independent coproporphyrinogen III oxidase [Holophaga sp.]
MTLPLIELVKHYDRPGPRYTGYPMPPVWQDNFPQEGAVTALAKANARPTEALSLYTHIPFCKRRCSYCGCNVVVSPQYAPVEAFLRALEAEVELWAKHLPDRRNAIQLHWGGGTPTYLKVPELQRAFRIITDRFHLLPGAEVAIEVDPTFLQPDQLPALRELGFNRVSFGVQDLDDHVQELITRGQTWDQTLATVKQARELGFGGVNLDLVYGLPGQTQDTFRRTLESTLELAPNRMAIYGFAYLPKMLPHQRTIPTETLPSPELRLDLLLMATEILESHGYVAVGMDHFARPDDELAKAVQDGRIIRNFMGYAVQAGSDCLGFGPSAISDVGDTYLQNEKILAKWEREVTNARFAIHKGHARSQDDQMRRWIIHRLMGTFQLRWAEVQERWGVGRDHFLDALAELEQEVPFGVLELKEEGIFITTLGQRFVRNLVFPFDAYLKRMAANTAFSRTV